MIESELARLHEERTKGGKAEIAYKSFIGPFIADKKQVLFEAFQQVSVMDTDGLLEVKRQLLAIEALDTEITTIINTGKMAAKSIAEEESKE